jgi:hypothetical protein
MTALSLRVAALETTMVRADYCTCPRAYDYRLAIAGLNPDAQPAPVDTCGRCGKRLDFIQVVYTPLPDYDATDPANGSLQAFWTL